MQVDNSDSLPEGKFCGKTATHGQNNTTEGEPGMGMRGTGRIGINGQTKRKISTSLGVGKEKSTTGLLASACGEKAEMKTNLNGKLHLKMVQAAERKPEKPSGNDHPSLSFYV